MAFKKHSWLLLTDGNLRYRRRNTTLIDACCLVRKFLQVFEPPKCDRLLHRPTRKKLKTLGYYVLYYHITQFDLKCLEAILFWVIYHFSSAFKTSTHKHSWFQQLEIANQLESDVDLCDQESKATFLPFLQSSSWLPYKHITKLTNKSCG